MPRPVVAANVGDAAGHPDISVFLYNWGPDFRILYKLDGLTGRFYGADMLTCGEELRPAGAAM